MPGAELEALLAVRDHRGVAAYLRSLDDEGLDAARRWYRRSGRKLAREREEDFRREDGGEAGTIALLLAVTLAATGHDAAKACAFDWPHAPERSRGDRLLGVLEQAVRRGPAWGSEFVESASQVKVRRSWDVSPELVLLTLPLVAHHRLEVPTGAAYVSAWVELAVQLQRPPHSPRWERCVARIDADGHAACLDVSWPDDGLVAFLRTTPRAQQTLERALETPAVLGRLGDLDQPGWTLEEGVRASVEEGLVARDVLLDAALATLARSDRPSEQRVTARLLVALDLGPADVATRLSFLLQVLSTVHGSVTAALLPALLAAPLAPDDLREAGSTVLLRKEKAQKTVLLDGLETLAPDDRLAAVATELWRQAAQLDDRTLALRAERALRGHDPELGTTTDPTFDVPWGDPPAPRPPGPFRTAEPSAAGLARLRVEPAALDPVGEARWLDVVVRYASVDPSGLRSETLGLPDADVVEPVTAGLLRLWAAGRSPVVGAGLEQRFGFRPLVEMLAAETLLRLGTPVTLLSTPSREDGSIAFDDLVRRLRDAEPTGYGPVDLLQALLRLEPTPVDRLALLDGLAVRPYDARPEPRRWWRRAAPTPDDATDVVRAWVTGGGVPARVAQVQDARASCPAVRLPAVPSRLVGHPVIAALGAAVEVEADEPHWQRWRTTWLNPTVVLGVVPWWAEAVAADAEVSVPQHRSWYAYSLRTMVAAPGPLGTAVHLHATRLLGAPEAEQRAAAVEVVLAAVGQGRLDPALFAEHSVGWAGSGLVPLARLADAWEQLILGGGLAFLQPTLRAVLERVTTQSPKPAGLAELLRMVRPYARTVATHVSTPVWSDGVVALARSSSASKARTEAQALLDAGRLEGQRA